MKSAVLLAGLHATGTTSVAEPAQTRDHTERALPAFGGQVEVDATGTRVAVAGGQTLGGRSLGGARRLLVGRVLDGRRGGAARLARRNRGRRPQPDADRPHRRASALRRPRRRSTRRRRDAGEPSGTVIVEGDRIGRVDIAPEEVPGLIDELPAIAALAGHGGEVSVRGAAELRVKESDRIAVLVAGFRALGIDADERPDGFVVGEAGRTAAGGAGRRARRSSDGDGVCRSPPSPRGSPSRIDGADVVAISYPGFFETLERLVV